MHFKLDVLTLSMTIEKEPVWKIKLYILPGVDPELDKCFQWCQASRELKNAMESIVAQDAIVLIESKTR
jgi:hypothetical protein